jgi:hypothetical protein
MRLVVLDDQRLQRHVRQPGVRGRIPVTLTVTGGFDACGLLSSDTNIWYYYGYIEAMIADLTGYAHVDHRDDAETMRMSNRDSVQHATSTATGRSQPRRLVNSVNPLIRRWPHSCTESRARELDMNHLSNITNRQRKSRIRDAVFAAFVALGAVVSITTISTVASAASTHVVSK